MVKTHVEDNSIFHVSHARHSQLLENREVVIVSRTWLIRSVPLCRNSVSLPLRAYCPHGIFPRTCGWDVVQLIITTVPQV